MKDLMEKVINKVTDFKAEADLIYSSSRSLKMSSQKGAISEYKVSSSQILGIRAIKDGKVGISYTESLDEDSLDLLVKQALANAEMSEKNSFERILQISGHVNDEATYPEEEVDIKVKTQKALSLESGPKSRDARVVAVPYNSFSESEFTSHYLSSRGRSASCKDKSYTITSSALMDDNGKKANFYDYHRAHTFDELDWDKVVETSLFHARNLLEEKSLPTGRYSVRFSEDCLQELMGCFSNFYSAKSAIDKMNPWAEKIGEKVISADLSITDEPLYERAFRLSKFDSEGVERRPLNLIENGVLKSFYHNSVTAGHFKTSTTGHASRGPASSLGVSGTHMVIKGKGQGPLPQKYLEVIQMDGLYSGANRVNGNFSVAVKGYVWENDQKVMTFGNITLSGNIIELLSRAEVTGTELKASTDESFFTVPLIIHDLSIAGT
ncbi:MAG: TldD/PmbA family protein [Bacteriovoracia bacterium]